MGGRNAVGITGRNGIGIGGRNGSESADTARPTIYTVFDQVRYLTSDHRPAGIAVLPYVPSRFKSVVDALKGRPLQPDMLTNGINVGGLRVAVSIHLDREMVGGIRVGLAVDKEEAR